MKSFKFSIFHQISLSRVYLRRSIIHEIFVAGSWKFNHVRIKYFSFSMQNFSSLASEISNLPRNFPKSKTRDFWDFRIGPSLFIFDHDDQKSNFFRCYEAENFFAKRKSIDPLACKISAFYHLKKSNFWYQQSVTIFSGISTFWKAKILFFSESVHMRAISLV